MAKVNAISTGISVAPIYAIFILIFHLTSIRLCLIMNDRTECVQNTSVSAASLNMMVNFVFGAGKKLHQLISGT